MDTRAMSLWPRCLQHGLKLTALSLLLALSNPVLAAIPFELDGNAVSSTGEDWSSFFVPAPGGYNGEAIVHTELLIDRPESPLMGIFTGGGSKDEQNIPNWGWRAGSPPAKDEISHAYAAQYVDSVTGHEILVFGMDRYDTSGDAQLGFWFLQGSVMPVAGGDFSGTHVDGDLLVLVNFSNGGTVPTIQAFKWVGDGETGGVVAQGGGLSVLCTNGGIPAGQPGCGITNNPAPGQTTPAPWTYEAKGSTALGFPRGAFFEGAIDLGDATDGPCFTNFLTESRSSTSITAVLKDFVAGAFPACSVKVTKQCSDPELSSDETFITYTITGEVVNDGGGMLHDVALSDDPAISDPFTVVDCTTGLPVAGASFPLLTLAGGDTVCYKNTFSVPLAQNGPTDTVTVTAHTAAGSTADPIDDSDSADCPTLPINPNLTIVKSCSTEVVVDGGQVVVQVNAEAEVCNTGDSALNTVAVTDDHAGTMDGPSIITKGVCETYTKAYFPSTPDVVNGTTPTLPGEAKFTDTATVTAKDILGRPVLDPNGDPLSDSTFCPLCPTCPDCPTPSP